MIFKLTVTFEKSELTKLEKDSEPYVVSTWHEIKFYQTAEEKERILNDWKRVEYSKSCEVSARPYRSGTVEEITSVKIKSIEEIVLSPVTKYFFLYSEDVGVNECPDGFGGNECQDDPWFVRIDCGGNRVRDIEPGVYLCCELGDNDTEIFTLSKEAFEEKYYNPREGY